MIVLNCPFFLLILLLLGTPTKCAVFENVSVTLTTQWQKLYRFDQPPIKEIVIESSNSLGDYVNLQPLEVVSIKDQVIPELTENSLADLPHVLALHITSSGIKKIEPGTLKNVPKLDLINLAANRIEEIKDWVFTNLSLSTIYLNNNKISSLGPAAFNNMSFLTLVSLSYNKISTWNSDWFVGTSLSNLYLVGNLIEELPADVFAYSYQFKRPNVPFVIWTFTVSNNKLTRVHEDAFRRLNGFGVLNLANNSLTNLPSNVFHTVKTINVLELSNNQLSTVQGLFDDINIDSLQLDKNRLSCFPFEIFEVSRISELNVTRNPFTCECVDSWQKFQEEMEFSLIDLKHFHKKCL